MSFQEPSYENDNFDGLDQLGCSQYMSQRPFRYSEEPSSEEMVESDMQENPFRESPANALKEKRMVFQTKNIALKVNNWSEKMNRLTKQPKIVRSAPELKNSHWDNFDNGEVHTLPILGLGRSDSIKRIDSETVVGLLTGKIKRNFQIVDARYKYEYDGGHIVNAVNVSDENFTQLLKDPKIYIFHCEFSSIRGPTLAQKVRDTDRRMNKYPSLNIPEMYVLEGGYKEFFSRFPEYCTPRSYVSMHDKNYAQECSIEHKKKKNKTHKF